MPKNMHEDNNPFKVEELKEAIADSLAAIKLNFDDEDSVKFLSTCFEKNIPANKCGDMESSEDYPFLCSLVSSTGSVILVYEATLKRIFLIPIDKDKQRDIQPENTNSLISLMKEKLEKCAKEIKKCAKDSNKTYNATILIINGENIYNKKSLINELEKSNINYSETKFLPGESKNIGISVHLSKGKNSSIRVKLFPFSSNLIYFPYYPKIPDVKKNHKQTDKVEFSIKLDGRNISLQYDKNDYLNAITCYHTINPKSPNSMDQRWLKFLGEEQLKIFNEIFTKIKNSYPEFERILIGGEFCSDHNTICSGFFIHGIRGIQGEKVEFLDIKKIHELSKESFPDFFSEAKENGVKMYFMRQWFNKIDSLPSNKEECKQLLGEVMSSLYGQDSFKKAKAIKNGLEGVVTVDINTYWPILKIKFDQHQDLNFDQLEKTKKSTTFDLTKTYDDILTKSRLAKIENYFFEENQGMENTISWAIGDSIKELQARKLFAGAIKKNILRIKERLETNIKEHLEHLNKKGPTQLSSLNSAFFNVKDETKMSQNSSDTNEKTVLTK